MKIKLTEKITDGNYRNVFLQIENKKMKLNELSKEDRVDFILKVVGDLDKTLFDKIKPLIKKEEIELLFDSDYSDKLLLAPKYVKRKIRDDLEIPTSLLIKFLEYSKDFDFIDNSYVAKIIKNDEKEGKELIEFLKENLNFVKTSNSNLLASLVKYSTDEKEKKEFLDEMDDIAFLEYLALSLKSYKPKIDELKELLKNRNFKEFPIPTAITNPEILYRLFDDDLIKKYILPVKGLGEYLETFGVHDADATMLNPESSFIFAIAENKEITKDTRDSLMIKIVNSIDPEIFSKSGYQLIEDLVKSWGASEPAVIWALEDLITKAKAVHASKLTTRGKMRIDRLKAIVTDQEIIRVFKEGSDSDNAKAVLYTFLKELGQNIKQGNSTFTRRQKIVFTSPETPSWVFKEIEKKFGFDELVKISYFTIFTDGRPNDNLITDEIIDNFIHMIDVKTIQEGVIPTRSGLGGINIPGDKSFYWTLFVNGSASNTFFGSKVKFIFPAEFREKIARKVFEKYDISFGYLISNDIRFTEPEIISKIPKGVDINENLNNQTPTLLKNFVNQTKSILSDTLDKRERDKNEEIQDELLVALYDKYNSDDFLPNSLKQLLLI